MATYRLISDIHCEFWTENLPRAAKLVDRLLPPLPGDADAILLLAGDTGTYRRRNLYRAVVDHLCGRFREVFDIPGNHYFYGGTDWETDAAPAEHANYRFGQSYAAGPIVAATLWADLEGGDPVVERQCVERMNDFRQAVGITPERVRVRHAEHVRFLRERIRPGCIVMTHFAPSRRSLAGPADPTDGYYATDLEALITATRPALWVHGHIHHARDYRIGATRVLCNPAGYNGDGHDRTLTITL